MKNLGKIFIVLLLIACKLFGVEAKITPSVIYEGDRVSLIITAQGDNIIFPELKRVAGYKVLSQSISRTVAKRAKKSITVLAKEYTFLPTKKFSIPPFEIIVDGDKRVTRAIKDIKIKKESRRGKDAFIFKLTTDKKEVYIGEPINVIFTFKSHTDIEISEANFNAPNFQNFWAKPTQKIPAKKGGVYTIYKIRYLVFPQKSGKLEINPGRMDIGVVQRNSKKFYSFERVKYKSLFSNSLTVDVKPLPDGIDIYGDFKFLAKVDKKKTKVNEPVNLTIIIKGIGNIDDIKPYNLEIDDALVYADKPEKKIYTNNKEELGEYIQKFAIVSDRDFKIDALEFKFFHSGDKEIRELKSESFKIEVEDGNRYPQEAKLERSQNQDDKNSSNLTNIEIDIENFKTLLFIAVGFLAGILTANFLKRKKDNKKREKMPLSQKIKDSKNSKELLSLLIPFADRSDKMRELIKKLDENVYESGIHIIDKREIAKNLDDYLVQKDNPRDILK